MHSCFMKLLNISQCISDPFDIFHLTKWCKWWILNWRKRKNSLSELKRSGKCVKTRITVMKILGLCFLRWTITKSWSTELVNINFTQSSASQHKIFNNFSSLEFLKAWVTFNAANVIKQNCKNNHKDEIFAEHERKMPQTLRIRSNLNHWNCNCGLPYKLVKWRVCIRSSVQQGSTFREKVLCNSLDSLKLRNFGNVWEIINVHSRYIHLNLFQTRFSSTGRRSSESKAIWLFQKRTFSEMWEMIEIKCK